MKEKVYSTFSLISLIAIIFQSIYFFVPAFVHAAGTLTSVSASVSTQATGATSNLTLRFTTENAVPVTGKISITLPSNFSWDKSAQASTLASLNIDMNGTGSGTPTIDTENIVYDRYSVVFDLPLQGSGLNAGDGVTLVIPGVVNPSYEAQYEISLSTKTSGGAIIDSGTAAKMIIGYPELIGKVTAPDGTTPIYNAEVVAQTAVYSAYAYAWTNTDGTFVMFVRMLLPDVPASGVFTATIRAPYGSEYTDAMPIHNLNIVEDTTIDLGTVRLTSPSIRGKLVKDDGVTAMIGTSVVARNSDRSVVKQDFTDANGNFELGGLETGSYIMEFSASWEARGLVPPGNRTISVTAGEVTNLGTIAYETPRKTISGTVLKSTGSPVTNAKVNMYREGGNGWSEATTDSSGNYSSTVGGGTWNVNLAPDYSSGYSAIDWSYNKTPKKIKFSSDNSLTETKDVDFTVPDANVTVSGRILTPQGTPLTGNGSVSAYSKDGQGGQSSISSDGTFSFKVPAGTYDLRIFVWDGSYGSPARITFTVDDYVSYNTGDIYVVAKNERITGTVQDVNGTSFGGQTISAWRMDGDGWASAQSGSDGSYSLAVFPGEWMITMYLDPGMMGGYSNSAASYIYNDPPKKVTVKSGETKAGNNLIIKLVDATIEGTIKDADGDILSDLYGYAFASSGSTEKGSAMMGTGMGAPVRAGQFTIKVPGGSYRIGVSAPPGSNYTISESVLTTVDSGETESVTVTALENNAVITGRLVDSSGSPITTPTPTVWINADNGNMAFQNTSVDVLTGEYSMTVSAGDWRLGYWAESSDYLRQPIGDNKVTAVANSTVTKDLVLAQADSTISGTIIGPDGTGLPIVWVSVDTRSGQKDIDDAQANWYSLGALTNYSGSFSIEVPQGTYYLKAFMPLSYGYINPEEVKVVVDPNSPATVNLTFRQPDATITGVVTSSTGSAVENALVWAYSEEGGYAQTTTDSDGRYTLNITKNDQWHIGAVKETDTVYAKSNENILEVIESTNTQNLTLDITGTMPESVVATFDATNSKTITLSDGTIINIPAGALASSGNVTVTATPKAEIANQDGAKPIGLAYDLVATDSNGAEITSTFSSNVTITLPYTDAQLTALGLDEDDLVPSYWDETTSTWKPMDGVVVNEDANTISFTTNHFTEFSLVGAADTTPPSAPSNVTVTDPATGGQLNLSWTNPTDTDFSSIKIYRSTTQGTLGSAVYTGITTTSKQDTGLTDGTTYYYTVRSVDTVGNESANTNQVGGTPTTAGSSTQAPGSSEEITNIAPSTTNSDEGNTYTYFSIHPNGSLITSPHTSSVYLLDHGQKHPIVTAAIFEARGYQWKNILTIQDSELNLYTTGDPIQTYPDGTLLKGSDGKVYVVSDQTKRYIAGPQLFVDLGYQWSNVVSVSDSHLALYSSGTDITSSTTHPNGTLIKATNGTSLYYLESGLKRGIASPEIFNAQGYKWHHVITTTQTELDTYTEGSQIATYSNGTLLKDSTTSKIYLISDGKKRLIPSPLFFTDMGYQWSNVITVSATHLDLYTQGADVKSSKIHPNGTLLQAEGSHSVYMIEQGKKRPIASALIFEANGYQWSEIVTVKPSELEMYPTGLEINTYPNGTLLQGPDGKIYAIDIQAKRYITGPEVFEKLGYKWNNIKQVSSAHLGLYITTDDLANATRRPNGTLLQGSDNKNVYLVEFGQKRLITSPVIFQRRGFQWTNIIQISGPELAQYSDGTNLNTYPPTSILKDENNKIYLVSNGKKHWFSGPRVFEDMGYQWSNVINVTSGEVANYTDGNNVQ